MGRACSTKNYGENSRKQVENNVELICRMSVQTVCFGTLGVEKEWFSFSVLTHAQSYVGEVSFVRCNSTEHNRSDVVFTRSGNFPSCELIFFEQNCHRSNPTGQGVRSGVVTCDVPLATRDSE
jgi:hypothetical protein